MSYFERVLVKSGSYLLPQKVGFKLAKALLASQGVGWAGPKGGVFTSGESDFLIFFLKNKQSPIVFDVGANTGDYAICCYNANKNSIIHCFEPSEPHRISFQNKIKKVVGNLDNFILNPFGLSDVNEDRTLYKDEEVSGLASLTKRDLDYANIDFSIEENVKLKNGDEYVYLNNINRIDLMKIDVEGWEMSVLQGFKNSFKNKIITACQFEFAHAHIERRENFRDFYNFFKNYGYLFGIIKPNGKINFIREYSEFFEHYFATNYIAFIE